MSTRSFKATNFNICLLGESNCGKKTILHAFESTDNKIQNHQEFENILYIEGYKHPIFPDFPFNIL
jgi:hypothetical protein